MCVQHGVKRSVEYGVFHGGRILICCQLYSGGNVSGFNVSHFINSAMLSDNIATKTITGMGMASCHSRMDANTRHLHACFEMNASVICQYIGGRPTCIHARRARAFSRINTQLITLTYALFVTNSNNRKNISLITKNIV